jgi:Beta xylosidase C-terminal Concanavalin A-like domain
VPAKRGPVWLRVEVQPEAQCKFSYSRDGRAFEPLGAPFVAGPGRWIGAKVGLVSSGKSGHADFDNFVIE